MKFHNLFTSSTSACFEFDNKNPFYSLNKFNIILNGKELEQEYEKNVFSVFGLKSDTEYTIETSLGDFSLKFRTEKESACLCVLDFGAKGDGINLDTVALQTAINACPKNGRVTVPAGTYLTGPLLLDSDMTLEICKDAIILGSTNPLDYPVWPGEIQVGGSIGLLQTSTFEGDPMASHQSLLSASYKKNIKIVGEGLLDGNAQNSIWWVGHRQRPIARPRMLFTNDCENIVMHGVAVKNSPSWNLHPFMSKNIGFYDMHIMAPEDSPNTDGCNPESCDDVKIIGLHFSVGDDAIAIKAGKIYYGMKYAIPASNHVIRNCLMEFAHGGVVLGSEMSSGIKDLEVSQCVFKGTDRGLRIKTRRGRGKNGIIDGIKFENIKMDGVLTPLVVNMFYFCVDPDGKSEYVQSWEKQAIDDGTPYIGKFHFKDIECVNCEYAAGFFFGLPEQPIGGITLENVSFHMAENASAGQSAMMSNMPDFSKVGLYLHNVKEVALKNVSFKGVVGDEIIKINVDNFVTD